VVLDQQLVHADAGSAPHGLVQGQLGPHEAPAAVGEEGLLLLGRQDVLGIHGQPVLGFDREVGEELPGVGGKAHDTAEHVVARDRLDPRDAGEALALFRFQLMALTRVSSVQNSEDADRHGDHGARRPDPVTPQVLGDVWQEAQGLDHEHTGSQAHGEATAGTSGLPQAALGATFLVTRRTSELIAQLTSGSTTAAITKCAKTCSQFLPSPPPLYSGAV
jgi:hypothetical protein